MSLHDPKGMKLVELNAAVPLINPLLVQFDLALFGQFGLSGTLFDLTAQFNAALDLQFQLGANFSISGGGISAMLDAVASIQASLQAALNLGLPTISADISASLSASAAITAALGIKLGGIKALIAAALSIKIPVINLLAGLNVGPVFVIPFDADGGAIPLNTLGGLITAECLAGLTDGAAHIDPGDNVMGVVLIMKDPAVYAALGTMLLLH